MKYAIFDDGEKETYSLEEGDLLVIRSNGSVSIVGQTALVKGHDMEYLYGRKESSSMNTQSIVSKVWSFCHVLRDAGVSYGGYLEQLTYLIFLKMADEYSKPPYSREWAFLLNTVGQR